MENRLKSIPKGFVSNEITEKLINEIMQIRGSNSRSQIIRDAIFEYRQITKPAYTEETAAGKLKALKLKEIEAEIELTPEQIADQMKARIVSDATGNKFVRLRGVANVDRLIKLSEFKEIIKIETWLANEHKNFIANGGEIPEGVDSASVFP
jgi:hypothetical protein